MEPLDDDWMELFEDNVNAIERRRRDQERSIDLAPMLRDAANLRMLDTYNPGTWDPSMYNEEVKGTWPKEYVQTHTADGHVIRPTYEPRRHEDDHE